jgi:hypothetical protein
MRNQVSDAIVPNLIADAVTVSAAALTSVILNPVGDTGVLNLVSGPGGPNTAVPKIVAVNTTACHSAANVTSPGPVAPSPVVADPLVPHPCFQERSALDPPSRIHWFGIPRARCGARITASGGGDFPP